MAVRGVRGRWQCWLNISNYSQSCIRHQRETGHELPRSRGEETTNWIFASKLGTMDLEKSLTSISMGNDFMKAYCTCWHGKRLGGGDCDYTLVMEEAWAWQILNWLFLVILFLVYFDNKIYPTIYLGNRSGLVSALVCSIYQLYRRCLPRQGFPIGCKLLSLFS